MGRYPSESVDSIHKDMWKVERAYFARCIMLAELCRILQTKLWGQRLDRLTLTDDDVESVFESAKEAVTYVNKPGFDPDNQSPHNPDDTDQKFLRAEEGLKELIEKVDSNWKDGITKEARERDAAAQQRLDKIPQRKLWSKPSSTVTISVNICSTKMGEPDAIKKLHAGRDDSLDGLLFCLAPPEIPRGDNTHITYHPHIYAQSIRPGWGYDHLQPWTTVKAASQLYLAHSKNKLPFFLLPQETSNLVKTDVLVRDLNSLLSSEGGDFVIRETRKHVKDPKKSWDEYSFRQVREFQELNWKVVIDFEPLDVLSDLLFPQPANTNVNTRPSSTATESIGHPLPPKSPIVVTNNNIGPVARPDMTPPGEVIPDKLSTLLSSTAFLITSVVVVILILALIVAVAVVSKRCHSR